MNYKRIAFFIFAFLINITVIYAVLESYWTNKKNIQISNTEMVLDEMNHRFQLMLDSILSQGIIYSEYFSEEDTNSNVYTKSAKTITEKFDEIKNYALLNIEGRIIKVYPYEENKRSLGRITQNLPFILDSFKNSEEYWLSPPFQLFQGEEGFVFYIPIKKDLKLGGWVATVVSIDKFFQKFMRTNFLEEYQLIIKDSESGRNFFATTQLPDDSTPIFKREYTIRGRNILFASWPKTPITTGNKWPTVLLTALILAIFMTAFYGLTNKTVFSALKIDQVDSLLRLSIQDARNGVIVIQNQLELLKLGTGQVSVDRLIQHSTYTIDLLDQIKVLQRISNNEEPSKLISLNLQTVIDEAIRLNDSRAQKKFIIIESLKLKNKVTFFGNYWLITQGVFSNTLQHAIQTAQTHDTLIMGYEEGSDFHIIKIGKSLTLDAATYEKSSLDRTLTGIKRTLQLHLGDLKIHYTPEGDFIYSIYLTKSP